MGKSTGRIIYTERALLQDAEEAMRGDIVRGLIELITNSDDAYRKCGAKSGGIHISVEHKKGRPWLVIVRDKASGMDRDDMLAGIAQIGSRTSGFEEGIAVRGNRGRGAKDLVAFGHVEFASIKDGVLTRMALQPNGDYDIIDVPAKESHRNDLGIKQGNGTVVTVTVDPKVKCPMHQTLVAKLRGHYQLRYVITDPKRRVLLENADNPGEEVRLRYEFDLDECKLLLDESIKFEDYDATGHLRIWRLPRQSGSAPNDPTRPYGILVRGRRTVYDNTLFSFDNSPHAVLFYGELDVPIIDDLIKDYDDRTEHKARHDAKNPMAIISRRREGLTREHPFFAEMQTACEAAIEPLIRAEEESERKTERKLANESTEQILDKLGREVARFLKDALSEIDEDPNVDGPGEDEFADLSVIPPEKHLAPGEEATFSVRARNDVLTPGPAQLSMDPLGVAELLDGSSVDFVPHKKLEGFSSSRFRVRGLTEGETIVSCRCEGHEALALILVRPPVTPPAADPPENVEFEKTSYKVLIGKRKSLNIRAPIEIVNDIGSSAIISSSSQGVIVKTGRMELTLASGGAWYEGEVVVEGRSLHANAIITAQIGTEMAAARVVVVDREDTTPDVPIELRDSAAGNYRAQFSPATPEPGQKQMLEIMTRHPSLAPVIGQNFERQDSPEWKAVLAEVVTEAIVRRILEQKYGVGSEPLSAHDFYYDMFEYSTRLMPRIQKICQIAITQGS